MCRHLGHNVLWMQVYDVRALPRLVSSIPFTGGLGTPALLRFHPKFSSTLLVASAKGTFTMADAQGAAFHPTHQVYIGNADATFRRPCEARLHVPVHVCLHTGCCI